MVRGMTRWLVVGVSVTALLLALGIAGWLVQHRANRPGTRIVLITLDTLRYDAVFPPAGRSGQESEREYDREYEEPSAMPLLRERAQAGTRFSRFYSTTSVTQPTHASLFTSLPPWEHGVTRNGQTLSAEHVTLAERLRDSGFQTHAVVASFPLSRRFGFGQGFDQYFEEFTMGQLETWNEFDVPGAKFFTLADRVTERAIRQISVATGDRQFFWFHYFDAHAPYGVTAGERFSEARLFAALEAGEATRDELLNRARRLYRLDVAYLDAALERLFARLDADSQQFETHIFVTSDHGESFGEAGSIGHGSRLTTAEIHVPAILISPRLAPGRRDDVSGAIDVAPTLLALAGLGTLANELGGRDLSRAEESPPGVWGMRRTSARKKVRERRLDGRFHELPNFWFYRVEPRGQIHRGNARRILKSRSAKESTVAEELRHNFRAFERGLVGKTKPEELDPETKAGLEALGYVQ
jgi:arylsulfatase A-like enzyme